MIPDSGEGMGMCTMVYRANQIGAKLTVVPTDSGGTLVTCTVQDGISA